MINNQLKRFIPDNLINKLNKFRNLIKGKTIFENTKKLSNRNPKFNYLNNNSSFAKSIDLGVLLPDIDPGSGGHRKVLSICQCVTKKGGNVEIAFISEKSDAELKK